MPGTQTIWVAGAASPLSPVWRGGLRRVQQDAAGDRQRRGGEGACLRVLLRPLTSRASKGADGGLECNRLRAQAVLAPPFSLVPFKHTRTRVHNSRNSKTPPLLLLRCLCIRPSLIGRCARQATLNTRRSSPSKSRWFGCWPGWPVSHRSTTASLTKSPTRCAPFFLFLFCCRSC